MYTMTIFAELKNSENNTNENKKKRSLQEYNEIHFSVVDTEELSVYYICNKQTKTSMIF